MIAGQLFYWVTNQQIIQRLGAKNLAEGQKGLLLASFLKIWRPLIFVFTSGMIAYHYFDGCDLYSDSYVVSRASITPTQNLVTLAGLFG